MSSLTVSEGSVLKRSLLKRRPTATFSALMYTGWAAAGLGSDQALSLKTRIFMTLPAIQVITPPDYLPTEAATTLLFDTTTSTSTNGPVVLLHLGRLPWILAPTTVC